MLEKEGHSPSFFCCLGLVSMDNTIIKIEKGSPCFGRVCEGEKLISVNGREIEDVLDYKYFTYDRRLRLELEGEDGRCRTVTVRKGEGEDPGLEFESYLMASPKACANRCLFCFVDQLPRGLRRTLYFKDDDARLSFLTGSYITLTNLSDREIQRIIDLRISPINVSVHATEPSLRAKLLGNPSGARGYELMKRLAQGRIEMNCQIVCCPGINDEEALSRTMSDLEILYPSVNSVSIVPVGLTGHRSGLYPLEPFDTAHAAETVDRVEAFADRCMDKFGSRIFFCSDELYIKAGRELPNNEYYEGYPQLENGVGLLTLLETEFTDALDEAELSTVNGAEFAIVSGVAAAPYLEKLLLTAKEKCDRINGKVIAVENDFFGHTIDVAGLVTGGDIINQLRGRAPGRLLIPEVMLRSGETVFLDDVTVNDVETQLGASVRIVGRGGADLLSAILEN